MCTAIVDGWYYGDLSSSQWAAMPNIKDADHPWNAPNAAVDFKASTYISPDDNTPIEQRDWLWKLSNGISCHFDQTVTAFSNSLGYSDEWCKQPPYYANPPNSYDIYPDGCYATIMPPFSRKNEVNTFSPRTVMVSWNDYKCADDPGCTAPVEAFWTLQNYMSRRICKTAIPTKCCRCAA
jgi:hypothetical protein